MSSHAKEITRYKDSIPKLLFLTTGKLTQDFEGADLDLDMAEPEIDDFEDADLEGLADDELFQEEMAEILMMEKIDVGE